MNVTTEMLENYVIIPNFLWEFRISMTAKLIYSVILTEAMRQKLVDAHGHSYAEMSIGQIAVQANVREGSVDKILHSLSCIGLIDYRKESNRIYPKKPVIGKKKSI